MNFHGYSQTLDNSYVPSPFSDFIELTNPQVGYNWYQSQPSSETSEMNFVAAQPWCCTQFILPSQQVNNSTLYYPHEYRPPPTPPHVFHSPEPPPPYLDNFVISAPQLFDISPEREPISVDKGCNSEVLNNAINVTEEESSMKTTEIEHSSKKLARNFDDSFVMDNLRICQNCSSITEYVEDYMHIKSRAEFIFECEFDDELLAYCFIAGLKEEIREALELWAPRTLQEAITLATFQVSLLEDIILVDNIEMKSDIGLKELDSQVQTRVGTTTKCFNEMSSEACKIEKQFVVEEKPLIILIKMEKSVVADKTVILLACVNDSQRQMTRDVDAMHDHFKMQITNDPTSNANTYGLEVKPNNISGEETMLIFDPGGNELKGYHLCVILMLKEMIRNKQVQQHEIGMTVSACGIAFIRNNKEVTEVGELIIRVKKFTELLVTFKLSPELTFSVIDVHQQAHESIKTLFLSRIKPGNAEISLIVLTHLLLPIHMVCNKPDLQLLVADLLWVSNNWVWNGIISSKGPGVKYILEYEGTTYCGMSFPQVFSLSFSAPPFSHLAAEFALERRVCLTKNFLESYVRKWLLSVLDNFMTSRLPRNATSELSLFYVMGHRSNRASFFVQGDIALNFFTSFVSPYCSFELHAELALLYTHNHKLSNGVSYDFNISRLKEISDLTRHEKIEIQLDYAKEWSSFVLVNQSLLDQFQAFNIYSKQIILGLCISGLLMGLLRWIPGHHQSRGTMMLSKEVFLKFCYCQCYPYNYQLIFVLRFKVTIVKRMASAWHWSLITLLFDPGNSIYGVTLVELVVVAKDQGNISDYGDGVPRKLQGYVLFERFAMHHDYNYLFWSLEKNWKVHTSRIWCKSFGNSISKHGECGETLSNWTQNQSYLVSTNVERLTSAWRVTTFVFDPGKFCCYQCTKSNYP